MNSIHRALPRDRTMLIFCPFFIVSNFDLIPFKVMLYRNIGTVLLVRVADIVTKHEGNCGEIFAP